MTNLPRKGDFDHQVLTGLFRPVLEDSTHRATYFGLVLEGTWFYGLVKTESGKEYALLRKVVGRTTRGMIIQASADDGLRIDPRGYRAASGGVVKRALTDEYDLFAGLQYPDGPSFETRIGTDRFWWSEPGTLDLQGDVLGPGFHVYVTDQSEVPHGGCYYTSLAYRAEGTVFGERVSGYFATDQSYLPHGSDWNDSIIWTRLQGAWAVFANEFEDGSVEWGHFSRGADRFEFAIVSDGKDTTVDARTVRAKVEYKPNGFVDRILYELGDGSAWEFATAPTGDMVDFSAARPGWRGQSGTALRVGETRRLKSHWAWQEVFPDRI